MIRSTSNFVSELIATLNLVSMGLVLTIGLTALVFQCAKAKRKKEKPSHCVLTPTEVSVKSDWRVFCDAIAPATSVTNVDSFAKPFPEEVFTLQNFLSETECKKIVTAAEDYGFGTTHYPKSYRGNLRLTAVDEGLASSLFSRVKPFVPSRVSLPDGSQWEVLGLNESFRLSKYEPGDLFQTHLDGKFLRSPDEQSMFTLNAYLNGNFSGGSTRFYNDDRDRVVAEIKPTSGLCLLFRQPPGAYLPHDGEEVTSGFKYLLRSDVMYRRIGTVLGN